MISFVVPAHNEETTLPGCLRSIRAALAEVAPNIAHEVIVVNDDSSDRTKAIGESAGAIVIDAQLRHIAAVRNRGAKVARGDIFIFLDADTELTPGTLRGTLAALDRGVIGGGARVQPDGDIPFLASLSFKLFSALWTGMRLAAGCYVFARRDAFERAGGWDERYFAGEEFFLSRALKREGRFEIVKAPVITSARKLRSYRPWEILRASFRILRQGKKGVENRDALGIWYEGRRESASTNDNHKP